MDSDEIPDNQHAGIDTNFAQQLKVEGKIQNAKIHAQEESLMEDLSNSEQQACKCFEHFDCCLCKDNSQSHKVSPLFPNEQPSYTQGKQKYKIPSDHGASGIADIGPRNLDLQVDRTSSHQNPFSVETVDRTSSHHNPCVKWN
ncbi:hypothetical protein L6452_16950 [Arctium lappa]|uniref:Uncharacterized protein n=1 Tax=Arctium lappa TaxID=4217 RepID=A0ACB9C1X2_ARCLA|nr:hypothetical protein L6452_16950 [Arctium lappa]